MPQDDALDRGVGVLGLCIGRRAHHVFAVPSDASISAPSTRRLLDGAAMPVPHHSIDGVIYESLRIRRSICTQAVGDCPSKLRILNEEGCLMRPRLSPEDQDLGSSATL